ncbi:unnamed protein product, partial [Orchesella dallaii]
IEIEQIADDSLKRERFYELVQKTNGSYESFCMSLLYGNQFHAFLLLKCHLQSTLDYGNVWATPPPSVSSFISSQDKKLMVLISKDVDLAVSRLKETIDTLLPVIGGHGLASLLPVDKLTIFEYEIANNQIIQKLESVITPGGKIICVCGEVSEEISNCEVITESFGWEDVSSTFSSLFRCTVGFSLVNFCDLFVTPEIIQVFGSYLLLGFKSGDACMMTELKLGHEIKTREGHSLSTTIFQYFLPDKLLFLGITQPELKLFAKFGQRIGHFGDDTSQLDYVILENMVGIEEICKIKGVNQVNVHLIEHTDGNFKLVRTFGDDSKIKKFIENPQICDNFPGCGCERGYENLVFKCVFRFQGYFYENITKEYSTSLNELLPEMRELLNIQDSVDLWEITNLLDKISVVNDSQEESNNSCEKTEIKSGFVQLTQKLEELFAHLNIEERELRELKNLAAIILFPTRTKNLIINNNVLEKFVTSGLLVKKEDESLTFTNQSLACYLVVNMLIENELHENFVRDLFRDCIEHQTIKNFIPYFSSGVEVDFSSNTTIKYQHISFESFKFTNDQLVKFMESVTFNHYEVIEQLIKKHIPSKSTIPWIYACVHGNHYNLLKILLSVESNATAFQSEQQIMLAVIYSRVQVIDLIMSHYVSQTSKQIDQIKLKISNKEMGRGKAVQDAPQKSKLDIEFLSISLLHLAALRGNYFVMEYLLNHFLNEKLTQSQILEVLHFCVVDTLYHDDDQISERIKMIHLFFKIFPNFILTVQSDSVQENPLFVPNIHVDLLQLLINKGLDDECSLRGVLHFCPTYVTPNQYDILVKFLDTKGKVGVVNCSVGKWKCSPLYRAVQHLELFDSTLEVFSCAKADFNSRILSSAVDHKRSASLLERLIRAGADFRKEEKDGSSWTVLHHAAFSYNLTALRYFIWKGCNVNAKDSNGNTPLHILLKFLGSLKVTHELVEALVQHGADVNVVGEDDQTPLSIAVEKRANKCLDKWTFELLERVAEKSVHTG